MHAAPRRTTRVPQARLPVHGQGAVAPRYTVAEAGLGLLPAAHILLGGETYHSGGSDTYRTNGSETLRGGTESRSETPRPDTYSDAYTTDTAATRTVLAIWPQSLVVRSLPMDAPKAGSAKAIPKAASPKVVPRATILKAPAVIPKARVPTFAVQAHTKYLKHILNHPRLTPEARMPMFLATQAIPKNQTPTLKVLIHTPRVPAPCPRLPFHPNRPGPLVERTPLQLPICQLAGPNTSTDEKMPHTMNMPLTPCMGTPKTFGSMTPRTQAGAMTPRTPGGRYGKALSKASTALMNAKGLMHQRMSREIVTNVPVPSESEAIGLGHYGQDPMQISALWYLNVHAPPPFEWLRTQAVLYSNILILTWIAPTGGRGVVTLDLVNCTEVRSAPSPSHLSA
ncbi:hypothetical protein CTheo_9068 [Ceratobasidium theobromae]|uniref:Uncharacterized protein n=1 Tax=Ceratobasidium theobromae TaxID=1582974 RepID=A0A5N5Q7P0_9AGAM|nr:hypothetical protein CTheo_9068 [Ceratobasidium theobromae]